MTDDHLDVDGRCVRCLAPLKDADKLVRVGEVNMAHRVCREGHEVTVTEFGFHDYRQGARRGRDNQGDPLLSRSKCGLRRANGAAN